MRILLIGGLGYIGSTLIDELLKSKDHDITVLDPLLFDIAPDYFHRILSGHKVRFVKESVADMHTTWNLIKQHDIIVYMASLTMPETAKHPEEGIFVNRYMAEMVGDCCVKLDKRMIFMSTCSNYGKAQKPVNEDGDLLPVSMYAMTKVDAEKYLLRNVPNITILRCATAYGVGAGRTRWDVLLNDLTRTALEHNAIDLFQPNAHRPICHVSDIARAIRMMVDSSVREKIYNVGDDSQNYTKKELADMVAGLAGAKIDITEKDDDRDYTVDFARIRDELGFEAQHTPESAIPILIRHWKERKG